MSQSPSNPLSDVSDAIAALVESAQAFTVTVYGRRRLPATGIVWEENLIVTANHVVEQDEGIEVEGPDGGRLTATVVGRDHATDIVVLRAEGLTKSVAPKAVEVPRAGELSLAIGRAGAGLPRVSVGMINTADAAMRVSRGRVIEPVIQSEIAMLPGFSGGPLLNARGEVVGINSSHLGRGASVTISVQALAPLVETLTTYGRLRRGYIGVGAQAVGLSESQAKGSGVGHEVGLVVLSIDEGGPAHHAGLLIGDILVAVNGSAVASVDQLVDQLPGDLIGYQVPLLVVRGSQTQEIPITVGERE